MQLRDALIQQAPSLELQRAAAAEIARMDAIEIAARRVISTFESLGTAQHTGALLMARSNCEVAMVALKAVLPGTAKGRSDALPV